MVAQDQCGGVVVLQAAEAIKSKEAGFKTAMRSGAQLADLIGFRTLIYP